MTPDEIAKYKTLLRELIPYDGSSKGNVTLLSEFLKKARAEHSVNLSESDYWEVRNELIAEGLIGKGRGKGGSVYLLEGHTDREAGKRSKERTKESDLYSPFYEVIKQTWVKENRIDDFIIQLTASQGKKKTGGKWTRPDISLVAVRTYEYIPGKILEVVTFEIKAESEFGIEGVFETAAHSVFAHKSYLAILVSGKERTDSEEFDRLGRMCERFGIGLLTFSDPKDWATFDEVVSPERKNPDPADINSFIQTQVNTENRNRIQQLLR